MREDAAGAQCAGGTATVRVPADHRHVHGVPTQPPQGNHTQNHYQGTLEGPN